MFKKGTEREKGRDPNAPDKEINWFDDPDVLYITKDKQRAVTLNPGREFVWFKKTYPVIGDFSLSRLVYNPDLPHNMAGKIVAVTAEPKDKRAMSALRGKIPYADFSTRGMLKAKPLGTYYELFQSDGGGYSVWTNPTEYEQTGSNKSARRKNYRVQENFTGSRVKLEQVKGFAKQFRPTNTNPSKNNTATGVKGKN